MVYTWPLHPCVQLRRGDPVEDGDEAPEAEPEPLIRVQRAQLTTCPSPPGILDGWLKPGWQVVDGKVETLEARNCQQGKQPTSTVAFADDAERSAAFSAWMEARERWAVAERPAVAARQLFEDIERGGRCCNVKATASNWDPPMDALRARAFGAHPVLMQRINLDFDPAHRNSVPIQERRRSSFIGVYSGWCRVSKAG